MVKLAGMFKRLQKARVLVAGDLMLDSYTIGQARRISPEAPVAVVQVQEEQMRSGGAGNVVLALTELGMDVSVMGRVGHDVMGRVLGDSLREAGASVDCVIEEPDYRTPVKNRIIADGQQIVRVDHETIAPLSRSLEDYFIETLPVTLKNIDVVAVSDYGKGFLSRRLLQELIRACNGLSIPVIVDPKGADFSKYYGADVIKPNFSEALAASGLDQSEEEIETIAKCLQEETRASYLMITRSAAGISLFDQQGGRTDFPAVVREVNDVTGAGDMVLAMLATSIANGLSMENATELANIAAGIAVERLGCVQVSLSELARRLLEKDSTYKVFEKEHISILKEALNSYDTTLLLADSKRTEIKAIFRAISEMTVSELVVAVCDPNPDPEFIEILTSFKAVRFVILSDPPVNDLSYQLEPTHTIDLSEGSSLLLC